MSSSSCHATAASKILKPLCECLSAEAASFATAVLASLFGVQATRASLAWLLCKRRMLNTEEHNIKVCTSRQADCV